MFLFLFRWCLKLYCLVFGGLGSILSFLWVIFHFYVLGETDSIDLQLQRQKIDSIDLQLQRQKIDSIDLQLQRQKIDSNDHQLQRQKIDSIDLQLQRQRIDSIELQLQRLKIFVDLQKQKIKKTLHYSLRVEKLSLLTSNFRSTKVTVLSAPPPV